MEDKLILTNHEVIMVEEPYARKTIKLSRRSVGGVSLHPAYDVWIVDGFTAEVKIKAGYRSTRDDIAILIYYGGNKRG